MCLLILSWATREEIPFIRVIREVPQNMKERLPATYRAALDTMVYYILLVYI